MGTAAIRSAAGWLGLGAAATAALVFAAGTWTGPIGPFVDRSWPLLTGQAISVAVWVGLPAASGWLLLRNRLGGARFGAGLLAAYGLPAGPQTIGTFVGLGTAPGVHLEVLGFAVYGVLLLLAGVAAIAALLGEETSDLLPPSGWRGTPLRWLVIAAVLVAAVLFAVPVLGPVGASGALEAFRHAPTALQFTGLLSGAALVAVAYIAMALNLPRVGAAMLVGLAVPLSVRWATGILGHRTEGLGAREPVVLIVETIVVVLLLVAAALLAREPSPEPA